MDTKRKFINNKNRDQIIAMYYILDCGPLLNDRGEALTKTHNCFRIANIRLWGNGLPIKEELKKNIPNPIEIEYETFRGYAGPPRELKDLCIPLMSKRLSEVLTAAGVDNIDYFPAVLRHTETGQTYDYMAFEIIGLVAMADLDKSEYKTYDGNVSSGVSFYSLAVDETKAQGKKLFRLKENSSAIFVHESIKQAIKDAGIDTLEFIKPENWLQL